MRAPRTLLAGSTALALVAALGTGAVAGPADDAQGGSNPWPAAEAPAAPARGAGSDDLAATGDDLAAALSGNAAVALATLNQLRAQAGVPALTADVTITGIAQDWAQQEATAGTIGAQPDAASLIPQGFLTGGELWASGPAAVGVPALTSAAASDDAGLALEADLTHVGVGYATSASGSAYLYLIVAVYPFRDVTPTDQFWPNIWFLYRSGVTTGYPDATFRPLGSVTREAMAAFLYRFWHLSPDLPTCDPAVARTFTDVTAAHPFCGAIEWLATSGISTGWADHTFRPGEAVTREAMAAFLYRFSNVWNETPQTPLTCDPAAARTFTDVTTAHPFCGAIEWLAKNGVSTGWADHTFRPGQSIERQAMAAFLDRFDGMLG